MTFNTFNRMVLMVVFVVFSAVGFIDCGGKEDGNYYAVPKGGSDTAANDVAADPVILSFGTSRSDYIMAPYTIENVKINGDILNLQVTYNGGCEDHLFELVALNDFLASNPVQADVLLTHDASNDNCDSLIKETLKFSLLSLKEEYKIVNRTESGTFTLRVQDTSKPDGYVTVEYVF